ncbi:MAG: GNAT family N-acetyltransferase [Acidiferrobacterales bacterium]
MKLTDIPTDVSNHDTLLQVLSSAGLPYDVRQSRLSPYIGLAEDFDTYFAGRSANTRSRLRRAWKKINAHGQVTIKKMTKHSEVINAVDTAFDISSKSWKADIDTDMGGTKASRQFYKSLSETGSRKEWIILWILYLDGEPAAMQYHVVYRQHAYLLRTDFDKRFADLSAGAALELQILKDYFDSDLVEYDLCGADYTYKLKLTSLIRSHSTIEIFNHRMPSRLLFVAKRYILPRIGVSG